MERGQLGVENSAVTVFVFENLIGHCDKVRTEQAAIRFRRWDAAVDLWTLDIKVCDYIHALVANHRVPVEVLTWRPHGFAEILHDRLWDAGAPVREVRSTTYASASQHLATDPLVTSVYDPEPSHRLSYGFKCRPFDLGRI